MAMLINPVNTIVSLDLSSLSPIAVYLFFKFILHFQTIKCWFLQSPYFFFFLNNGPRLSPSSCPTLSYILSGSQPLCSTNHKIIASVLFPVPGMLSSGFFFFCFFFCFLFFLGGFARLTFAHPWDLSSLIMIILTSSDLVQFSMGSHKTK